MAASDSGIIKKVVAFIMLGARRGGKFTAQGFYRQKRRICQHSGPIICSSECRLPGTHLSTGIGCSRKTGRSLVFQCSLLEMGPGYKGNDVSGDRIERELGQFGSMPRGAIQLQQSRRRQTSGEPGCHARESRTRKRCKDGARRQHGQAPSPLSYGYDRYSLGSRVVGLVEDNRGRILRDRSISVDGQDVKLISLSLRDGRGSAGRKRIKILLVAGQ
jgi:hypothetical protein